MKFRHWFSSLIIFALLVLGIGHELATNAKMVIIPLVIFGVVFYLIKRPPSFNSKDKQATYYRNSASTTKQSKPKKDRPRSKSVPFKVIEGGRDDNDTPRFH
ncbi:MAG TPA: hypothetical protein IAA29_01860 [Candidatus Paenibacillus intestinavium]|nr:hypothetical protein [Candidatus Paenibacillus intestinavium]